MADALSDRVRERERLIGLAQTYARAPDRAGLLAEDAPVGVQAVGFTPDEFQDCAPCG